MTQIIIVSHSKEIAEGTKALINQMVGEDVGVVAQGGANGNIGTSYDDIQEMINQLDNDALCFYDIGSAEMNLDLAIEMYEGNYRVEKMNAPIVEGAFNAAVKISVGNSIDEVVDELNNQFN
ncbi:MULTISPECIES: dihydroxyacetone kinase phosphoryl donor subunit DhaM [Staphylococcus]|jgi:dihydroxyacetone kinase phosphotransfer subunit|uniref:phosphoenolpyruvate--glycerone phosphotransferase n=1 Tax=Staphylococcus nepalensis TaxID=214473 RepID=A0A291JLY1_9STAP|nr:MULTISPECIES: dihydroxyacetone kinase phosphoryl donor subunit DhaM [Staphylococcus]VDG67899.1 dihydroxyacetone kinase, phosphotransfer subunit [Lacrimispora indolis]ATH60901.1 PTS-dependent dihydroxyacetone kinase phosphotransferase subunit DhaM [Staphylococcus nepalensis]ATH65933.1 PTS-dependent dihydroxyacetone kinase phosphotransferase subunit DhaM [Staphylococcus nepalensis]AWI45322.1 PTS-dependent dihydroxyacetone kinase phosphotransferase subunit DhaM [Staphylococcus nepalensis]MBO12